jgi:hypothetical protein
MPTTVQQSTNPQMPCKALGESFQCTLWACNQVEFFPGQKGQAFWFLKWLPVLTSFSPVDTRQVSFEKWKKNEFFQCFAWGNALRAGHSLNKIPLGSALGATYFRNTLFLRCYPILYDSLADKPMFSRIVPIDTYVGRIIGGYYIIRWLQWWV